MSPFRQHPDAIARISAAIFGTGNGLALFDIVEGWAKAGSAMVALLAGLLWVYARMLDIQERRARLAALAARPADAPPAGMPPPTNGTATP